MGQKRRGHSKATGKLKRKPRAKKRTELLTIDEMSKARHLPVVQYERPQTRADCIDGPRPCPFVGCRYHTYLDVMHNGSIRFNFPDQQPGDLEHSCVLDLADEGDRPLVGSWPGAQRQPPACSAD